MSIDYDEASQTYDSTRRGDTELILRLAERVSLTPETAVLDLGCGTGNYLQALRQQFGCCCCGVEPSSGMRRIAERKDPQLIIRAGDHQRIPFADNRFDFAFMTNVIHHVPDLPTMFPELKRVLTARGLLCVATESHGQIAARFYNRYFPSLLEQEIKRYPTVGTIVDAAHQAGLRHLETESIPQRTTRRIDSEFISNVAQRNYSMFRSLSDEEFTKGLTALQNDEGREFVPNAAGRTLIWFAKGRK